MQQLAQEFQRNLPQRIRDYLEQERGLTSQIIETHLLGWTGTRISIPIFDKNGQLAFFKLARDPENPDEPKMLVWPAGASVELYGWERVSSATASIIVCEGEFDRLVLESHGFAAVTSTGGAGVFRPEWAERLESIPDVFVCFDNDSAGRSGVERVAELIPRVRIATLPPAVGEGGDITDFFVRLGRGSEFPALLASARPRPQPPQTMREHPVSTAKTHGDIQELKSFFRIENLVTCYLPLRPSGRSLLGKCPFHEDRRPSFVVYPEKQNFHCFGCRAHGDVITFLMRAEKLTFPEAVKVLRELTHNT